jgi:hypothetical protein
MEKTRSCSLLVLVRVGRMVCTVGCVALPLERGAELGERGEVFGSTGGGLASDDVLQRCDGDV